MTETHQSRLLNILLHLQSIQIKNDQQQQQMRYSQFHDMISILSTDIALLDIRVEQIQYEFYSQQQALQLHIYESLLLKNLIRKVVNYL
ncbi:unnamed protein product [Rotaria sordida]|uniref:Uncharacterized protein n=1 Tax=Rotaria sordida TaxID=392033 RepID=A0A815W5I1_9BILA|nr:unnamed protein product [Rotaria sordida]CAF4320855.1 unnamed protein product [Rotaria sordida]